MATEIERKFLINEDMALPEGGGVRFTQGYLPGSGAVSTRVRIAGDEAWLTIKGPTEGNSRLEFEYPIPLDEAEQLLTQLCERPLIDKRRYLLEEGGKTWELDIFAGDNLGLRVAEVELESEDEAVELPEWVVREVSGEARYYNVNLVRHPYSQWSEAEKNSQ